MSISDPLWSFESTNLLIELRIKHDELFEDFDECDENITGWEAVLYDLVLETEKSNFTIENVKKKWRSLNTIYNDFNNFLSTKKNLWPYYDLLNFYFKSKSGSHLDYCRLCQNGIGFYPLTKGSYLYKLIYKYLKIMISKDPKNFPRSICKDCYFKIKAIQSFRSQCQNVNKQLQLVKYIQKKVPTVIDVVENQERSESETVDRNKCDELFEDFCTERIESETLDLKNEGCTESETGDVENQGFTKSETEDNLIEVTKVLERKEKDCRAQFLCWTCGEAFVNRLNLELHEKRHLGKKDFKCSECDAEFFDRSQLRCHFRVEHLKLRYACKTCPKIFRSISGMKRHELTHTRVKELSCNLCDKKYFTTKEVRSHMNRMHGGQKKLSCSFCFKNYFTQSELTVHIRSHTGERPFVCDHPGCDKNYADKFKLQDHVKRKHQNIKRKDYKKKRKHNDD